MENGRSRRDKDFLIECGADDVGGGPDQTMLANNAGMTTGGADHGDPGGLASQRHCASCPSSALDQSAAYQHIGHWHRGRLGNTSDSRKHRGRHVTAIPQCQQQGGG
jgi:hypothetical protein